MGYRPKLVWKNLRVTAGVAYTKLGTIGLSRLVLRDEAAIATTLKHEYAHLLAVARHGTKAANHGKYWQAAMLELGEQPEVRHRYEVERNSARQWVAYRCLKCGQTLTRRRRLPRGKKYVHATCGGDLRLIAVQRVTPERETP
jgi:SprT protein